MSDKTIITISRQYGSGGRLVGEKLAEELGIPYYDKKLITRVAEESGYSEELFEQEGEAVKNPIARLLSYANTIGGVESLPVPDKMFLAQSKVIRQIAEEGSCVIIGRCSDYVLEEAENCTNVFVHSDIENRILRVMKRNSLDRETARERVEKIDKQRASYYQHYTDLKWGRAENYDLSISSSRIGIDGTVEIIKRFVELAKKNSNR